MTRVAHGTRVGTTGTLIRAPMASHPGCPSRFAKTAISASQSGFFEQTENSAPQYSRYRDHRVGPWENGEPGSCQRGASHSYLNASDWAIDDVKMFYILHVLSGKKHAYDASVYSIWRL